MEVYFDHLSSNQLLKVSNLSLKAECNRRWLLCFAIVRPVRCLGRIMWNTENGTSCKRLLWSIVAGSDVNFQKITSLSTESTNIWCCIFLNEFARCWLKINAMQNQVRCGILRGFWNSHNPQWVHAAWDLSVDLNVQEKTEELWILRGERS